MTKAVKPVNLFIDEEKAQEIRDKLLMYRFKNLGKTAEKTEFNSRFQNARVVELFISLLQAAPSETVRQRLLKCMAQITRSRLEEEQASVEARIFDAVLKCELQIMEGKIATQAVTDAFNEDLPEKEKVTSRFVGRKLRALGFEKCRVGNKGQAGFYWDNKLVERLKLRYSPPSLKTTSETSETSVTSAALNKNAPLTPFHAEVSEVIFPVQPLNVSQNTFNAEVSEETEVSEVSLEGIPKPFAEPTAKLEALKSVYWSDGAYGWHKCEVCGYTKLTSWKAESFKAESLWLCEDCKEAWEKRQQGDA